ncbi:MAG: hydrogenase 2 large subunit [Desulforhopalus sp.]|nr:hydrogenase 2 large subunit [Desulforhopalus sp.]
MKQRITVDPITRIEGHLRVDCEIEDGVIKKAWSSGTMWRGIEKILVGRNPEDAWVITQRICGVCTTVHAIASVRAVEDAIGAEVPLNAQYIRNIITAGHCIHDNIVHFYQLSALDWVDITSALKADPQKAADLMAGVSSWPGNSVQEFTAVQKKVNSLVDRGQLGIFANGYWGHKDMKLSPEVNLICVAHYLQALECQRNANKAVAVLGGKSPHIQNLAVGGVANPINLDGVGVLNMERLLLLKTFIDKLDDFVEQVYKPDVAIIAAFYPEWLEIGAGIVNYLSIPELPTDTKNNSFIMPGGYIENGDLSTFREITTPKDEWLRKGIAECSKHAWYSDEEPLAPWEGKTNPSYTEWDPEAKYSWSKSVTFYGKTVQVGPLAQVLAMLAKGDVRCKKHLGDILGVYKMLTGKVIELSQLHSTIGRIAARGIRCAMMKDAMSEQWQTLIDNIGKGDITTWIKPEMPDHEVHGVGFLEAPRGMLSHWIVIDNGKIANYQAVVPSTWNAGPRNQNDEPGPYEASLVGTPVADAELPLEVIRTIHSFDPCMSCAIHMVDEDGEDVTVVKVL